MKKNNVMKTCITAVFIALTYIMTAFIQIPIPLGYANLGDSMILLACFMFGPWVGCIAGGAGAYADDILTLGLKGKLSVEGGHAVDLAYRDAKTLCNYRLGFKGKIAEKLLRLLHNGHKRTLVVFVQLDKASKLGQAKLFLLFG